MICVFWQNIHLGSELTKRLSGVHRLGVVRFRKRVKGKVNIFSEFFFYLTLKFFLTQSVERQWMISNHFFDHQNWMRTLFAIFWKAVFLNFAGRFQGNSKMNKIPPKMIIQYVEWLFNFPKNSFEITELWCTKCINRQL